MTAKHVTCCTMMFALAACRPADDAPRLDEIDLGSLPVEEDPCETVERTYIAAPDTPVVIARVDADSIWNTDDVEVSSSDGVVTVDSAPLGLHEIIVSRTDGEGRSCDIRVSLEVLRPSGFAIRRSHHFSVSEWDLDSDLVFGPQVYTTQRSIKVPYELLSGDRRIELHPEAFEWDATVDEDPRNDVVDADLEAGQTIIGTFRYDSESELVIQRVGAEDVDVDLVAYPLPWSTADSCIVGVSAFTTMDRRWVDVGRTRFSVAGCDFEDEITSWDEATELNWPAGAQCDITGEVVGSSYTLTLNASQRVDYCP